MGSSIWKAGAQDDFLAALCGTERWDAEGVVGGGMGKRLGGVRGWGLDFVSPVGVEGREGVGRKDTGEEQTGSDYSLDSGRGNQDGGPKGGCLGYWLEGSLVSGEKC